jgi:hypothetical protein
MPTTGGFSHSQGYLNQTGLLAGIVGPLAVPSKLLAKNDFQTDCRNANGSVGKVRWPEFPKD